MNPSYMRSPGPRRRPSKPSGIAQRLVTSTLSTKPGAMPAQFREALRPTRFPAGVAPSSLRMMEISQASRPVVRASAPGGSFGATSTDEAADTKRRELLLGVLSIGLGIGFFIYYKSTR